MSPPKAAQNIFEQYDMALDYARDRNLPDDHPRPRPTANWPPENRRLLERYEEWLLSGGTSQLTTKIILIPMAGHVLGLFLKPHDQLDPDVDLQPAMDYVEAKKLGHSWTKNCRCALIKFRRFLLHERGIVEVTITPYQPELHTEGLPEWLVSNLERYQVIRQRNWRPARLENSIRRFWCGHLRLWRFLCGHCGVVELTDVKRQHLFEYMEHRLKAGRAASGVNGDLRDFHGFLVFLQDQGYTVPQALLRVPGLKEPSRLPKFLTDEQVRLLRDDFEERVLQAELSHKRRDALLDRAAFYLLWQSGMRLGEVEELLLEDLELNAGRLRISKGKGLRDRTIYLTETVVQALRDYLEVRGVGSSEHVFLYRNLPVKKDLIRSRIKAAGNRVGVMVYPHRLRHTCATQLLNAGCRVTSIQRFLGHQRLNSTMIYARVHDHTVAEDYYTAMERVEERLELISTEEEAHEPIRDNERKQILGLADQLAEPKLTKKVRLELVAQIKWVLNGRETTQSNSVIEICGRGQQRPPPPSPAFVGVGIV